MSRSNEFFTIFRAIVDVEALSKGRMDVMISLLRHRSNETGLSHPGIALICREVKYTKKYVIQFLNSLEKEGYISVVSKHGDGQNRTYHINSSRLIEQLEKETSIVAPVSQEEEPAPPERGAEEAYYNERPYYHARPPDNSHAFIQGTGPLTNVTEHYRIIEPPPAPEDASARHMATLQDYLAKGDKRSARLFLITVMKVAKSDVDSVLEEFLQEV